VGLLLAGPGVIATLTFAPVLMVLFYSSEFEAASELLRWLCLGMTLRVITWPLGYVIVAKGEQTLFLLTEIAWTVVFTSLAWFCVGRFGLNGAGIAFFGAYVFHGLMVYPIVRRFSGFRWSAENVRTLLVSVGLVTLVFVAFRFLPRGVAMLLGSVVTVASGMRSFQVLVRLVPPGNLPPAVRALLRRLCPAQFG
jgi:PST family polysaccharide transporter